MRIKALIVLLGLLGGGLARAQHGTIDADETMFTVLTAINMAGYDAELDSPTNHPIRRQIRDYLAAKDLASVARLKAFYAAHEAGSETADLSQYISYALVATEPPEFALPEITYTLPDDVQRLEGLGPLLAEFYHEADIPALYQKIQPAVEEIAARYHEPVTRSLFDLNGYLRNPTSGVAGRSFRIIIALMGAPNQIQTRSYRSNYTVVVSPSVELQIEDIRYTYLHYILEPVASRARKQLERVRPLGDYALGAPYLPDFYKEDFQLLATSSLVKAIEARLRRIPEDDRLAQVNEQYRRGYILTPAFYELLPDYEKQALAMRFYLRQMLDAIDLSKEEARAQTLEFDQEKPVHMVKATPRPAPELSKTEKLFRKAEDLLDKRDLDPAREIYLGLLRESSGKPVHARAYYGLARVATLKNDPELAVSLFERALSLDPKPREKAWILLYLGRLSDISGAAEKAAGYYRDALAVEGGSKKARAMAEQGARGEFRH